MLSICVLLTKRIPIVLALWKFIPDIKTFREAVFCGHFGPMGVGAIFIATLGRTLMPEEVAEPPETSNDVLALTISQRSLFFRALLDHRTRLHHPLLRLRQERSPTSTYPDAHLE